MLHCLRRAPLPQQRTSIPDNGQVGEILPFEVFNWRPMKHDSHHILVSYWWPFLTDIRTWISNYIHHFIWDVITHPCPNFNSSSKHCWSWAWMYNYIPWIYVDLITYPCLKFNASLSKKCSINPAENGPPLIMDKLGKSLYSQPSIGSPWSMIPTMFRCHIGGRFYGVSITVGGSVHIGTYCPKSTHSGDPC